MARKKTQAYSEEFRREAILRSEQECNATASVAKELGISTRQIYHWRRQFTRLSDKQFNTVEGVDYSKKESEALRQLKRKNAELEKEIEFLKKADVGSTRYRNTSLHGLFWRFKFQSFSGLLVLLSGHHITFVVSVVW